MFRSKLFRSTMLVGILFVAGCNQQASPTPTTGPIVGPSPQPPAMGGGASGDGGGSKVVGEFGKMNPYAVAGNLKKLSPEDRELADAYRMCLVCDKPLGINGVPINVDVDGQPVLICCAECRAPLLADKEKLLAKLPKKKDGEDAKPAPEKDQPVPEDEKPAAESDKPAVP